MLVKFGPASKALAHSNTLNEFKSVDGMHAESALLRWINTVISTAGHTEVVQNLGDSFSDGLGYGRLLSSLYPNIVNIKEFIKLQDPTCRAQEIVRAGHTILGPKCILEAQDILQVLEFKNYSSTSREMKL
jgi:hypothetical protein